jgi:integrase
MIAAGVSAGTIRLRLYHLRCWERVCPSPTSATRDALVAYLGSSTRWSPEYRRSIRSSLVVFYDWLTYQVNEGRDGDLPRWQNPAARLPKVRVPVGLPRPAGDEQVRAALADAPPRVWLMIMLGVVGGLRRAEIARVRGSDLTGRHLLVHGKGGRVRVITLPAWLAARVAAAGPGWVFPSPDPDRPLTPGHVGVLISRALPAGVTPHQLRHAAATELLEQGLTTLEIRDFLGHASVTTTQRYVQVRDRRTAAATERSAARFLAS